jgi:hypothetical protein
MRWNGARRTSRRALGETVRRNRYAQICEQEYQVVP